MATPTTMIIRALQLFGEKALGATLSSDEQTTYLAALNSMLESWSLNRLLCYQVVQESTALTASVGSFTIGTGGTWNTTRPTRIDQAWVRTAQNLDFPVEIVNAENYNLIVSKTIDNAYPGYLYYDSAYVGGLGTIYLYPEPASGLTLYISSWKQLQTFAAVGTTVVLPPGYERAIIYNLAIELAPGMTSVQPEVIKIAKESLAAIESLNAPSSVLRLDAGVIPRGRRYDIYADV